MKHIKPLLFLGLIILLTGIYIATQVTVDVSVAPKPTEQQLSNQNVVLPATPGIYTLYSDVAVQEELQDRKVVLFFYAGWCPSCRTLDASIIENVAAIPEDVAIFKVDYDTEKELKRQYGITQQHTFVLLEKEKEAVVWRGSFDLEGIISRISTV